MALKQALNIGSILNKVCVIEINIFVMITVFLLFKVHRIIKINQSSWLADYITLDTEMRIKADNEFKKNFFKLMNNSVFGMYDCQNNYIL